MRSLLPARFPLVVACSRATPCASPLLFGSPSQHRVRPSVLCFPTNMSTLADTATAAGDSGDLLSDGRGEENREDPGDVVVQYVVLRRDLIEAWPLGSIVAQGCHASVAAIWSHRDHSDTAVYCSDSNLDTMHKVTLEVKGETQIRNLSEKLEAAGIGHKLWIEQPENIPTCLATRPYPRSQIASFFKKLKLCK